MEAPESQIALGPDDEKGGLTMNDVKPPEVCVAPVQRYDGLLLQGHGIEKVDIVYAARCQTDKGRNGTSQVQKGMKLDGSLGLAERGPGKERQAKIDRC